MSYATLDELRSNLGGAPAISAAYRAKMLHPVPQTTTVNREGFIVEHCRGKDVLDCGASGSLSDKIHAAAGSYVGIDRESRAGVIVFDLDDITETTLPQIPGVNRIVCAEVLEHLSNPGWFLTRLKQQYPGVPLIISVPNAFSTIAQTWIGKGLENVNVDHVAWYSPFTLSVLLDRCGYETGGIYWYGVGDGPKAEGFVVVTE